jgi:dihydrofolate reductase
MTLDGVVQAPGAAGEDPSGGFAHGGWHQPYFDDLARQWVLGYITGAGAYLLGRRTYEIFAAHWPDASPEEVILAAPLRLFGAGGVLRPLSLVSSQVTSTGAILAAYAPVMC